MAHIAGKIFINGIVARFAIRILFQGIGKDNSLQILNQGFLVLAGQLLHISKVDARALTDTQRQCLTGCFHALGRAGGADGALGEHIRLADEIALAVEVFQGTQQKIPAVIPHIQRRAAAVDESKLSVVVVVLAVEFGLQLCDDFIRHIFQLGLDQFPRGVPQFDQQTHTRRRGSTKGNLAHNGVLAVVKFAVTDTKAEIAHIGFGRYAGFDSAGFLQLDVLKVKFTVQMGHGFLQHIVKGLIGKRFAGQGLAIRTADGFQCAADHFGVFGKIAVEGKSILRLGGVQPACVLLQNAVTLLQEDNIRHSLGSC